MVGSESSRAACVSVRGAREGAACGAGLGREAWRVTSVTVTEGRLCSVVLMFSDSGKCCELEPVTRSSVRPVSHNSMVDSFPVLLQGFIGFVLKLFSSNEKKGWCSGLLCLLPAQRLMKKGKPCRRKRCLCVKCSRRFQGLSRMDSSGPWWPAVPRLGVVL